MSDKSVDIQRELNGAELSPGKYDTDHDIDYSDQSKVRGTAAPD